MRSSLVGHPVVLQVAVEISSAAARETAESWRQTVHWIGIALNVCHTGMNETRWCFFQREGDMKTHELKYVTRGERQCCWACRKWN